MAQQRYTITGFVIDEDTYDFKDVATGNATTTESGFMSASDKLSLDDVVQAIANMYTKAETDAKFTKKQANITPSSISANSYAVFTDTNATNKLIVGFYVSGVATKNVSVLGAYSDSGGTTIVIKNNENTAVTPNGIRLEYIDP